MAEFGKIVYIRLMSRFSPYIHWIATQESLMLSRIKEWVAISSYSLHSPGLAQCLKSMKSAFKGLGGEMSEIPLSPFRQLDTATGEWKEKPLGNVLLIQKRPKASHQILLGGHFDTVYPPDQPLQLVRETREGLLLGSGIADMKGGIAILLIALEALERSPFAENMGWRVLLTPDEEIGSPGSAPYWEEAATHCHSALIFEPALPDGTLVSERGGSLNFSLRYTGKAAHVGRDYTKGTSAVFPLARLISVLDDMRERPGLIVNVADLFGKGPLNVVPAAAGCRINLRSRSEETLESAANEVEKIAKELQREGVTVEIQRDSFRPSKPFNAKTEALFHEYAACAKELEIPFNLQPSGGVCDGNIVAATGCSVIDTAGAVGGALHTAEEYIVQESLVQRAQLATLFLLKIGATCDIPKL